MNAGKSNTYSNGISNSVVAMTATTIKSTPKFNDHVIMGAY